MPDGRDRHLFDEPEIELTVTTLSLLVRDAGKNGTGGAIHPKRLRHESAQPLFYL